MKSPIKIHKKDKSAQHAATTAAVPNNVALAAAPRAFAPPVGQPNGSAPAPAAITNQAGNTETLDLERRRAQLSARVAELQWDLGGLAYEMAVRNRMRPDVIVKRAAVLQEADAELGEVERILRMERTGVAALCLTCGAPHSAGAVYCWQCGTSLLEHVPGLTIAAPKP